MMSITTRSCLYCAVSSIGLVLATPPVWAQEGGGEQASDSGSIAEIIVTARRRDETLQTTPVAITAIATEQLEAKGTLNISDLQGASPNLLITQQNSGAAAVNLSIRGLTYADVEKSQEPTVGVVVDGVFIGTSTGQLLDFFDIKQIEVLRGPQGTLFGRNTIGGVINIQRTRPTGELGAKVEGSYGSFNSWAIKSVFNAPIAEDILAAKLWFFHNESDGYYRNAITGKRAGGSNNDNYGISLLLTPGKGNFDALLTVEQQIQNFDVVNSNITNSSELFCGFIPANECNRNNTSDLYTVYTDPAASHYKAPAGTLEMNLDLDSVKLTSITGYRQSDERQTQDFDSSSTDLYYTLRIQDYKQWSQEIRGAGKISDTFDYVVGLYYFSSEYNLTQYTRLFAFNSSLSPEQADSNPQLVNGKTRSYAAFGDFNWAFADRFRLSFGGRWTHDKKELTNAFRQTGLVGSGDKSFEKFTPKISVDFRPNEDAMVYASWSQGYRSGGFSPRAATAETASTPYKPETVDSFEVGTKLDLLDNRLQFNVAAFYSKYNDMQQNTTIPGGPTGNQTITSNVGSATIKGLEVDFNARPTEKLRLNGSMGLLDSKFKDFIVGNTLTVTNTTTNVSTTVIRQFDYSDNNMIYSPKFNASLGASYSEPMPFGELVASVGYRYISPYDQQISLGTLSGNTGFVDTGGTVKVNGNDSRVRTDKQGLLDASLSGNFDIGSAKAKLTVYGRNLADDRGTSAAFTVAGNWSFASAREPRTFGVSLGLNY